MLSGLFPVRLIAASTLLLCFSTLHAETAPPAVTSATLPDAPSVFAGDGPQSSSSANPASASTSNSEKNEGQQTSRILGIMPNFRSVSVDEKLPPLTPKKKFTLMLQDSFDYSSFIYVGMLAGVSDAQRSYPEFGHGAAAYGRYYWHSFADNVGGNLMTEALVPIAAREDPRYYTLGRGGLFKRSEYSISRLLITRTDGGNPTFNFAEIVGNGAAAGISTLYYPSPERTWTKTGQKWLLQVGLDGVSNVVKEFWPDVNHHFQNRK